VIAQVATALVFFAGEGVDPSTAQIVATAVKEQLARLDGGAPVDLSTEHRTLLTPRLFEDFTAPAPKFLPPELAASWKSGSQACAQQAGPTGPELPPQVRADAAAWARSCREALGLALWDLLLKHRQLTRVVRLELRDPRSDTFTIHAALDEVGTRRLLLRREHVSVDNMPGAAVKAVEELLSGRGTEAPVRRSPLPAVGFPALEETAMALGPPRPAFVPEQCRAGSLPGRLEVFPLGKFTRALEVAYKTIPAEKRTGKPLRCDLVVYPGNEPASEKIAFARLVCPPAHLRASESLNDAARLVSRLVDQTVKALCSAQ